GLRHFALFDAVDGLSVPPVENEDQTCLRGQRQRGDLRTVAVHLEQDRTRLQIEIVNVVVDCLEVPLPLSGQSVESDQRIAEQIRSRTVTAKEIRRRRTVRQVDEPQ